MTYNALTRISRRPNPKQVWIPVLCGLAIILGESTQLMGAGHTGAWLLHLINLFHAQSDDRNFEFYHILLRKCGHFTGYGLLGTLFARAWTAFLQRRVLATWTALRVRGAALGVASAFAVACADEFHQRFLPGRVSSFRDVMIDTSGAIVLNILFYLIIATKRKHALQFLSRIRTIRQGWFRLPAN